MTGSERRQPVWPARARNFYDRLCDVVGTPERHGGGPDAFIDSPVWGGMNAVEPSYTMRVSGTHGLPADTRAAVSEIATSLKEARADHIAHKGTDVDVSVELVS